MMLTCILFSVSKMSSSGVRNFVHSCVPLGIILKTYSAPKMTKAQEAAVLFWVVINKEPPGYSKDLRSNFLIKHNDSKNLIPLVIDCIS